MLNRFVRDLIVRIPGVAYYKKVFVRKVLIMWLEMINPSDNNYRWDYLTSSRDRFSDSNILTVSLVRECRSTARVKGNNLLISCNSDAVASLVEVEDIVGLNSILEDHLVKLTKLGFN